MIPSEVVEAKCPKVGPFYFYRGMIIVPEDFQRKVNPTTFIREGYNESTSPLEHRDMWDGYMLVHYPELKSEYNDDHKALPRGRVDYRVKDDKLNFFITLDKCITGQENTIMQLYNLAPYDVMFSYGAMNYTCRDC